MFFRILACSTVSVAFNAFMFRATAAYDEVTVWAHQRSVLLKFGLRMPQLPASMELLSQETQSQPCGGKAAAGGRAARTTSNRAKESGVGAATIKPIRRSLTAALAASHTGPDEAEGILLLPIIYYLL